MAGERVAGFVSGTLVHTRNGPVAIERIRVGDVVLSRAENGDGEHEYRPVTKTHTGRGEVHLIDYFVTDETEPRHLVVASQQHFFVKGAGWTPVEALEPLADFELPGDKDTCVYKVRRILATGNPDIGWTYDSMQEYVAIDLRDGAVRVTEETADLPPNDGSAAETYLTRTVYDIDVDGLHTYFVGGPGVWVRSRGGDDGLQD
jgi:hypothetical protein